MSENIEKSKKMVERELQFYSKSSRVSYYDIVLDRGEGALLYDVDGNEYIDLLASASATNTGHCHPKVVKAIQEQADMLVHYTPAYIWHTPEVELAEKLAKLAPGDSPKKVAFGNSGSDANDAVIKFARAYTGRPYIISFIGSYHGSTYGSMSLSAISLGMRRKMGPLLPGIYHVPYPNIYQEGIYEMSEEEQVEHFFKPIEEMFKYYVPVEETAAFVLEPIAGDLGIVPAPKLFWKKLHEFCQEHGILFAIDEVNQGLGRTGKMWSIDHYDIEPDIMVVGKSIASGMPLSAIIAKAEIMDSLSAPAHLFTTAGNPICCAASLATLEVIEEEHLAERSEKLGKHARERFEAMKEKYNFIGFIHGAGLNMGVTIIDPETKQKDQMSALKIVTRAFQKGVCVITIAESVIRFQPPLVITEEQLDKALNVLDECMQELLDGKLSDDLISGERGW